MEIITVYDSPMTLKQIQEEFHKTPAAVGMAIKRMLERNPEHQEWKIKEGRNVLIAPEGVMWLSEYFRGFEVAPYDEEKIKMEAEIRMLKGLLESEKKHNVDLKESFDKALTGVRDQYLLETSKVKELEIKNNELANELGSFKKTIFGLYKKQKTTR